MPDIADFRAWDNRLLKGYSPGYFNINDEVLGHVKEAIWTKYGFTARRSGFDHGSRYADVSSFL
jgi:hypothetical protein